MKDSKNYKQFDSQEEQDKHHKKYKRSEYIKTFRIRAKIAWRAVTGKSMVVTSVSSNNTISSSTLIVENSISVPLRLLVISYMLNEEFGDSYFYDTDIEYSRAVEMLAESDIQPKMASMLAKMYKERGLSLDDKD